MKDYNRTTECPDCGATLMFASGCYFCPSCGYGKCGKHGLLHTVSTFVLLLIMLSLMGWSVIDTPPRPAPCLDIDRQWLKMNAGQALAEQTAIINADMERRARQ